MNENDFTLEGFVTDISPIQQIRRTTKPDLIKRTVTIVTESGQKVFMEIRNAFIKELQREGIEKNSFVEVDYTFEGSEKSGNKYNNIVMKKIKLLK